MPAGLALSRDNAALERASRVLALCGAVGGVGAVGRGREAASRGDPDHARLGAGDGGDAGARPRRAEARARAARTGAAVRPRALRGVLAGLPARPGLLQVEGRRRGAPEFQTILDHRGELPVSLLYPLAHLGAARAATLMGDPTAARRSYDSMLELWKAADPN